MKDAFSSTFTEPRNAEYEAAGGAVIRSNEVIGPFRRHQRKTQPWSSLWKQLAGPGLRPIVNPLDSSQVQPFRGRVEGFLCFAPLQHQGISVHCNPPHLGFSMFLCHLLDDKALLGITHLPRNVSLQSAQEPRMSRIFRLRSSLRQHFRLLLRLLRSKSPSIPLLGEIPHFEIVARPGVAQLRRKRSVLSLDLLKLLFHKL
mmetsp:Transcript_11955/g.28528  ORF Transcript_11955/g.28528 Transcript_11955/m.28528 type:complete len:201 (+) Transcript_11955:887-1489(+)